MAKIERFEDLDVWKLAIVIAVKVYKLTETGKLSTDFGMKDQIRRAASSISNNIAEGFEYNNNKQFTNYLKISKGSCGELRNQIFILKEVGYISLENYNELNDNVLELSRKLASFIKYLKSTV